MVVTNKLQIDKKDWVLISIILFFAFAFRLIYFNEYVKTDIYPLVPFADGDAYYRWARDIASGDFLGDRSFMKWPLYAYFLSFMLSVSRNSIPFVHVFQFVLGTVNCLLIYFIAKQMFNRTAGFFAGILYACYGIFIFFEGLLIYSSLSLFLNSALFLFLLLNLKEVNRKKLFFFGVFLGFCTLTQANIIIFGFLAFLWLVASRRKFKYRVAHFLCFLLGLSLVVGMATLKNYLAEKNFVLIAGNTGINFYLGNNPEATGLFYSPFFTAGQEQMFKEGEIIARKSLGRAVTTAEVSDFWFEKSFSFIKNKPLLFFKLLVKKLGYSLSPREYIHDQEFVLIEGKIKIFKVLLMNLRFILPLAVLGMILGARRFKDLALLYIAVFSFLFSMVLFFVTTRYRISLVAFLIIFSGFSLASILNMANRRQFRKLAGVLVLLVLILLVFNFDLFVGRKHTLTAVESNRFNRHLDQALIHEWKKDYQKALDELILAERINPQDVRLKHSLGTIYFRLNDFDKAERYLVESVRMQPLYIDSYYNLGFLYNLQGRFDEAIRVLRQALDLYFRDPGLHFELAKAYKAKGEFKKAKEEFELSLEFLNRWRKKDIEAVESELRQLATRNDF